MTWAALVLILMCLATLATMCLLLHKRFTRLPDAGYRSDQINLINSLLPQTQCGQCGYPGCRPYAEAIYTGDAINRCPPGGGTTINRLATLLERPAIPLNPRHGIETEQKVAFIREAECIGCTKCIQACPVDAIIGAPKRMHTVMVRDCTGCDLCVAPCPVDCIDMLTLSDTTVTSRQYGGSA